MAESSNGTEVTGGGAPAFAKTMIETARNWGNDDSGSDGEEVEEEKSTDDSYAEGIQDEEASTASMPGANLVSNFKSAMDQLAAEEENERKTAQNDKMSKALQESFC